jgi:hypothetical protein
VQPVLLRLASERPGIHRLCCSHDHTRMTAIETELGYERQIRRAIEADHIGIGSSS